VVVPFSAEPWCAQGETGDAGQQSVKGGDVVALTRQQHEADQVTERIGEDRNLGGQTAA
jgi:hypothetical protein